MALSAVNHFEAAREFKRIHEQNMANEDKTTLSKWRKGQEARLLTDSNEMLTLHPPELHKSPAASELDPEDHRSEERRPNKETKVKWVRKPKTIRPPKLNHSKSKKRPQRFVAGDSGYRVKSPWQRIQKNEPEPLKPVPQKTSEKTRAMIRRDRTAAISEEKSMFCFGLPEPETHYPVLVPDKKSSDAPSRNVRHEVAYTRNTRPISSSSNSSGTEPRRRKKFAELKEQCQRVVSRKRLVSNNKEQSSSQIAENFQWAGDKDELVQRRRFSRHTMEDFGGTLREVLGPCNSNNVNNR